MDEVIALTRELVALPSRNPPGEERACAEFIFQTLVGWGIAAELVPQPDPQRPQVVAWVRGTEGPTLILNGHVDTVPEGDPALWPYPPFEATIANHALYGLGTADMKSQLAVAMLLLKAVKDVPLRGALMLHVAMGEELAEPGTRTLLQHPRYRGDYAIVMEPTNLRIAPCTRGVVWYRIILKGVAEHCGVAEQYVDPVYHLAQLADLVQAYHARIRTQQHALLRSPACVITQVRAGEKHNHIAGQCELTVDRRLLPGESIEQVQLELQALLDTLKQQIPEVSYELALLRVNEPAEIPSDHPLVHLIAQAATRVTEQAPSIWGPPYGSDVRNYILDAGIPAVNFGPGDFKVCHTPHEHVSLAELSQFSQVLAEVIHDLLLQPTTAGPTVKV